MIEVRTFDGTARELSDFCTGSWRKRYEGRMAVPLWSPEFLEWELLTDDHQNREFMVAAYDKTKLVGVLPARPARYHFEGRPVSGTWGSFFAVDPEYENEGVSLKLNLEQRRRHRQHGADVFMGFVYFGSSASMGKDFWLKQRSLKIVRKLGLWARIFNHRAVSDFEFSPRDKWFVRALGLFQGPPRAPRDTAGIRPFLPDDLSECLALARRQSAASEWGYDWSETSLLRHLSHRNVSRTLVAEVGGRVAGFVSWCHLDLLGRRQVKSAVIDVATIDELPRAQQKTLLRAALSVMRNEGCDMALMLRLAGQSLVMMHQVGFIAQPAEYYYVAQSMGRDVFDHPVRKLHVHWR